MKYHSVLFGNILIDCGNDTPYYSIMPKDTKLVTVTISGLPSSLRDELDKLAREEHRDRSSQIVKMIEDALKVRVAAKKPQLAHAA